MNAREIVTASFLSVYHARLEISRLQHKYCGQKPSATSKSQLTVLEGELVTAKSRLRREYLWFFSHLDNDIAVPGTEFFMSSELIDIFGVDNGSLKSSVLPNVARMAGFNKDLISDIRSALTLIAGPKVIDTLSTIFGNSPNTKRYLLACPNAFPSHPKDSK